MNARIQLKKIWDRAKARQLVSIVSGLAFLIILIGQALLFSTFRDHSGPLVIHYTRDGIDQFGTLAQVLGYGVIGWVVVGINYAIALELEYRDWFWGKFVAAVTLGLSILLFTVFQAIITVN